MKWTKVEIEIILEFVKNGKSYSEISKIVNRTEESIRSKLFRLEEKTSKYYEYKNIEIKCKECGIDIIDLKSRNRKFCSQRCNAVYNNRIRGYTSIEHKKRNIDSFGICLNCQSDTGNKKYCNRICQHSYEKNIIFTRIEGGDNTLSERNYKKYLIYKYGEKCMDCGWCEINKKTNRIPIQIEHIDGHSENNNLNNLKLLCPNCHSLTPTYGFLNKGNGRKKRYKLKENNLNPSHQDVKLADIV